MREVPVPQAETRAAVTQQTAPVAAAAAAPASGETPFYKKMFGGVADLFSAHDPTADEEPLHFSDLSEHPGPKVKA